MFVLNLCVILNIIILSTCIDLPFEYIWVPGPLIPPTKGQVWPRTQQETKTAYYFSVKPCNFNFNVVRNTCSILIDALLRYKKVLRDSTKVRSEYLDDTITNDYLSDPYYLGNLDHLEVSLGTPCSINDYPSLGMNEEYTINITAEGSKLSSDTIWGILRGLDTFSQIIYLSDNLRNSFINTTNIYDYPRFSHRGLLLDTSRHYIEKEYILRLLDAMSYNKLNVFHWHIVDDYSFPYVSKRFPKMSGKGKFHKGMVYDPAFVARVIEYARNRGIRVLVEFDTPGHTLSWGLGNPELLTPCYNNDTPTGGYGPIDPTKDSTYTFLYSLFEEIADVFVDQYLHLGGDEVDFTCWESNSNINQFMSDNNISGDYVALQSYFFQKVLNFVSSLNQSSIVWEEVFVNGVELPTETVVHVWISDTYQEVLSNVTAAGNPAILSACWYLDQLQNGGDWLKYYQCDAQDFDGTEEQKARVLGGEACMWSEVVNENNLEPRIWPRASAAAEKLWSDAVDTTNILVLLNAAQRIEEQTCRLIKRGIHAQPPNGPSICL